MIEWDCNRVAKYLYISQVVFLFKKFRISDVERVLDAAGQQAVTSGPTLLTEVTGSCLVYCGYV